MRYRSSFGGYLFSAHVPDARRLYGIVVVVVVFSVVIQGSLVPAVARRLKVAMRTVETQPWGHGVRLRDKPDGVHRFTIQPGSPADGTPIKDLPAFPAGAWINLVVRDERLVRVRGDTPLQAGDKIVVLADDDLSDHLKTIFECAQHEEDRSLKNTLMRGQIMNAAQR